VTWHIAMKRSFRKAMKKNPLGRVKEKLEKAMASVCAKVEHPFHVLNWLAEPFGARTPELRPECQMRARARKNEPDAQTEARKIIDLDDTEVP